MVKLTFSRYVQTSRRVHGKIVQLVPTPIEYCEAYLSREASRGKKYFTIDVSHLANTCKMMTLYEPYIVTCIIIETYDLSVMLLCRLVHWSGEEIH